MANDLQELFFGGLATKEQQTLEHKRAIRQSCDDVSSIEIRSEMRGMQWALHIVLAEINRKMKANG